jgi:hypothetical protein
MVAEGFSQSLLDQREWADKDRGWLKALLGWNAIGMLQRLPLGL